MRVYDRNKNLIHESTCEGDAHLDAALRGLERRRDFGRAVVAVEAKMGREARTTAHPVQMAVDRHPACLVCEMSKAECDRRSSISGHTYRTGALKVR